MTFSLKGVILAHLLSLYPFRDVCMVTWSVIHPCVGFAGPILDLLHIFFSGCICVTGKAEYDQSLASLLIVICNAANLARVICSLHSESLFHSISQDNQNRLMRGDAGILGWNLIIAPSRGASLLSLNSGHCIAPLLIVFETLVRKHLGNTTSRNVEAGPRSHTKRKCNRMLVGCS
jgi:hypothetical protein